MIDTLDICAQMFIWFLIYSFCGWVFECVYCSIKEGEPINRGFLNGPYCPIYGAGAVGSYVLFGTIQNPVLVFFLSALACSALEYAVSYVMELIFHARWWDYSERRFNLNGRVCLAGATLFGVACTAVNFVSQPILEPWTESWSKTVLFAVSGVLFAVFVADIAITNGGLVKFRSKLDAFSSQVASLPEQVLGFSSQVENFADELKELLSATTVAERLANARSRGLSIFEAGAARVFGVKSLQRIAPWSYAKRISMEQPHFEYLRSLVSKRPNIRVLDSLNATAQERMNIAKLFEAFEKGMNYQERRVVKAFPTMRPSAWLPAGFQKRFGSSRSLKNDSGNN